MNDAGLFLMTWWLLIALPWLAQESVRADPHSGQFTQGLGVGCEYCHEGGDWSRSAKASFSAAAQMRSMLAEINERSLKSRGGITCFTCHRGTPQPRTLSDAVWRSIAAEWPATAAVSERDRARPARERYLNLQVLGSIEAEDLRRTMSVIAASLGVNCEYCHAGDEWDSDNKPAKTTAREMLRIDLPREIVASDSLPVHCFVCHQGSTEPERARRDPP